MVGLVTRSVSPPVDARFDTVFYEVKGVTGRTTSPVESVVNIVACHGDTATSEDPQFVAVDANGRPATPERPYFDWGYVCPTHLWYREDLLERIAACGAVAPDVRLDDVGFPRDEYCHCDRCERAFAKRDGADRQAWRADVITSFVREARDRIPGDFYLTLYPDPIAGHLYRRSGLDVARLAEYVDRFVIPIYDLAYETTYWIEVIASGFADRLDVPFVVELYAPNIELENLCNAASVAEAYADDIAFAYDEPRAIEALEHLRSG